MRRGILLGDSAGVGKGRQQAGTFILNTLLGRRKAIWISVSNDLALDAARDVFDLVGVDGFDLFPVYRLSKCSYVDLMAMEPRERESARVQLREVLWSRNMTIEAAIAYEKLAKVEAAKRMDAKSDFYQQISALKPLSEYIAEERKIYSLEQSRRGIHRGIVFCTYSALHTQRSGRGSGGRKSTVFGSSSAPYKYRLGQLIGWCGRNFHGCVFFDEAHKAKNLLPSRSSDSTTSERPRQIYYSAAPAPSHVAASAPTLKQAPASTTNPSLSASAPPPASFQTRPPSEPQPLTVSTSNVQPNNPYGVPNRPYGPPSPQAQSPRVGLSDQEINVIRRNMHMVKQQFLQQYGNLMTNQEMVNHFNALLQSAYRQVIPQTATPHCIAKIMGVAVPPAPPSQAQMQAPSPPQAAPAPSIGPTFSNMAPSKNAVASMRPNGTPYGVSHGASPFAPHAQPMSRLSASTPVPTSEATPPVSTITPFSAASPDPLSTPTPTSSITATPISRHALVTSSYPSSPLLERGQSSPGTAAVDESLSSNWLEDLGYVVKLEIETRMQRAKSDDFMLVPSGDPYFSDVVYFADVLAHTTLTEKGRRKAKTNSGSKTSRAVVLLQYVLPGARIIYASATGASEARHLSYTIRLGIFNPFPPSWKKLPTYLLLRDKPPTTSLLRQGFFGKESSSSTAQMALTDETNLTLTQLSPFQSPPYAFPSLHSFLAAMADTGNAGLELCARDMKHFGSFLARGLSTPGATFEQIEIPTLAAFHRMYSKQIDLWRRLYRAVMLAADVYKACWNLPVKLIDHAHLIGTPQAALATGLRNRKREKLPAPDRAPEWLIRVLSQYRPKKPIGSKGKNRVAQSTLIFRQYWGALLRAFKSLAISAKVPAVAELTREGLRKGMAVVIGLQGTGESITKQVHESMEDVEDEDEDDLDDEEFLTDELIMTNLPSGPQAGFVSFVTKALPMPPVPYSLLYKYGLESMVPESYPHGIPGEHQVDESVVQFTRVSYMSNVSKRLGVETTCWNAEEDSGDAEKKRANDTAVLLYVTIAMLRRVLLEAGGASECPPNPLDDLIDRLGGPQNVAEMTGRRIQSLRIGDNPYGTPIADPPLASGALKGSNGETSEEGSEEAGSNGSDNEPPVRTSKRKYLSASESEVDSLDSGLEEEETESDEDEPPPKVTPKRIQASALSTRPKRTQRGNLRTVVESSSEDEASESGGDSLEVESIPDSSDEETEIQDVVSKARTKATNTAQSRSNSNSLATADNAKVHSFFQKFQHPSPAKKATSTTSNRSSPSSKSSTAPKRNLTQQSLNLSPMKPTDSKANHVHLSDSSPEIDVKESVEGSSVTRNQSNVRTAVKKNTSRQAKAELETETETETENESSESEAAATSTSTGQTATGSRRSSRAASIMATQLLRGAQATKAVGAKKPTAAPKAQSAAKKPAKKSAKSKADDESDIGSGEESVNEIMDADSEGPSGSESDIENGSEEEESGASASEEEVKPKRVAKNAPAKVSTAKTQKGGVKSVTTAATARSAASKKKPVASAKKGAALTSTKKQTAVRGRGNGKAVMDVDTTSDDDEEETASGSESDVEDSSDAREEEGSDDLASVNSEGKDILYLSNESSSESVSEESAFEVSDAEHDSLDEAIDLTMFSEDENEDPEAAESGSSDESTGAGKRISTSVRSKIFRFKLPAPPETVYSTFTSKHHPPVLHKNGNVYTPALTPLAPEGLGQRHTDTPPRLVSAELPRPGETASAKPLAETPLTDNEGSTSRAQDGSSSTALVATSSNSGNSVSLVFSEETFQQPQYRMQPRVADVALDRLILQQRAEFQSGKKLVAIISEAASSGVSLHADLRVRNQRRRLHITLELPWSAESTTQQFGRSNRANQVTPPHYILPVSDCGGERRFVSTVASRLESMGAITQGDRNAKGTVDLAAFNMEGKAGAEALRHMIAAVAGLEEPRVKSMSFASSILSSLSVDGKGPSVIARRVANLLGMDLPNTPHTTRAQFDDTEEESSSPAIAETVRRSYKRVLSTEKGPDGTLEDIIEIPPPDETVFIDFQCLACGWLVDMGLLNLGQEKELRISAEKWRKNRELETNAERSEDMPGSSSSRNDVAFDLPHTKRMRRYLSSLEDSLNGLSDVAANAAAAAKESLSSSSTGAQPNAVQLQLQEQAANTNAHFLRQVCEQAASILTAKPWSGWVLVPAPGSVIFAQQVRKALHREKEVLRIAKEDRLRELAEAGITDRPVEVEFYYRGVEDIPQLQVGLNLSLDPKYTRNVKMFLNRLLTIPLHAQALLLAYYLHILELVSADLRSSGQLDGGIVTLRQETSLDPHLKSAEWADGNGILQQLKKPLQLNKAGTSYVRRDVIAKSATTKQENSKRDGKYNTGGKMDDEDVDSEQSRPATTLVKVINDYQAPHTIYREFLVDRGMTWHTALWMYTRLHPKGYAAARIVLKRTLLNLSNLLHERFGALDFFSENVHEDLDDMMVSQLSAEHSSSTTAFSQSSIGSLSTPKKRARSASDTLATEILSSSDEVDADTSLLGRRRKRRQQAMQSSLRRLDEVEVVDIDVADKPSWLPLSLTAASAMCPKPGTVATPRQQSVSGYLKLLFKALDQHPYHPSLFQAMDLLYFNTVEKWAYLTALYAIVLEIPLRLATTLLQTYAKSSDTDDSSTKSGSQSTADDTTAAHASNTTLKGCPFVDGVSTPSSDAIPRLSNSQYVAVMQIVPRFFNAIVTDIAMTLFARGRTMKQAPFTGFYRLNVDRFGSSIRPSRYQQTITFVAPAESFQIIRHHERAVEAAKPSPASPYIAAASWANARLRPDSTAFGDIGMEVDLEIATQASHASDTSASGSNSLPLQTAWSAGPVQSFALSDFPPKQSLLVTISPANDLVVYRPDTGRVFSMGSNRITPVEIENRYAQEVNMQSARDYWEQSFYESEDRCIHGGGCSRPDFCQVGKRVQRYYVLLGALLPLWDKLHEVLLDEWDKSLTMKLWRERMMKNDKKETKVNLRPPLRAIHLTFPGQAPVIGLSIPPGIADNVVKALLRKEQREQEFVTASSRE